MRKDPKRHNVAIWAVVCRVVWKIPTVVCGTSSRETNREHPVRKRAARLMRQLRALGYDTSARRPHRSGTRGVPTGIPGCQTAQSQTHPRRSRKV